MKKIFLVMAVALVSAVMFNACKDDTTPEPTPTPTPTPDPQSGYAFPWDSAYVYEDEDSTLALKMYNVYDAQAKTTRTTVYGLINGNFGIFDDTIRYLDQSGKVALMKVYQWDGDDMKLYMEDSIVYSYNGNTTTALNYQWYQEEYIEQVDSMITMTDANGRDTLKTTFEHDSHSTSWEIVSKDVWEYDAAGRLTRYSEFTPKNQIALKEIGRDEYFYDKNGVDTLHLAYSAYNPQQTLRLRNKFISTVNAAGKKDLTYVLLADVYGEGGIDTIGVDKYIYDVQNRLAADLYYSYPDMTNVHDKDTYTYDQFNKVHTHSAYEFDGESALEHLSTTVYFRSK